METKVDPQLEVEAVQKIGLHEQCKADNHVIDNTCLKCDPVDYNRYNEVVGLCLDGHHEYSDNHNEGEMEQALPKSHRKSHRAKTKSQWMNRTVTEQKCHQRSG